MVRRSGLTSFGAFLETLGSDPQAMTEVIAALTTNHTYFHREPHHFDHFASVVRPDLVARAQAGATVRLWSAGCSSGEEIWTLLMVLLGPQREAGLRIARSKLLALASDISVNALAGAKAATYPASALDAVPEALRRTWCAPVTGAGEPRLAIDPAVQAMVRFRMLNLMGDWPMHGAFDVIFCRNVVIYFDEPTQMKIWSRFSEVAAANDGAWIRKPATPADILVGALEDEQMAGVVRRVELGTAVLLPALRKTPYQPTDLTPVGPMGDFVYGIAVLPKHGFKTMADLVAYGSMTADMADPGQDPRDAPDIASLWNVLDLTPHGRGTDWYPALEY